MKAIDFYYDGLRLRDFGMMLCKFDGGGGVETIDGAEITFNTISTHNGLLNHMTSATYEDALTFTLQICPNLCDGYAMDVDLEKFRDIMRWLNRDGFHKFKLIDDEYSGIYFMASFNVSKVELSGRIIGLELNGTTNAPYAFGEPVEFVIDNDEPDVVRSYFSKSDQEGFIYPNVEITVKSAGTLEIHSITEDRVMKIDNCVDNEVITIDYPIIQSSVPEHKIQNDFNWIFYRVSTSFRNRQNEFTASLPCTIKITYSPIIKVGV